MRRPDEDRDVERAIAQQPVGVRGHRPREVQPRMGRDERDELAGNVAARTIGVGEMTIDSGRQRRRAAGIPGASDRRLTDHRHG